MPRENVEVVRGVFEAFSRRDPGLVAGHLESDGELDMSLANGPDRGIYRGRPELRAFAQGWLDAWDDVSWEPVELLELDEERVLSVGLMSMRGRHSGIDITATAGIVWTVRDGKIAHAKLFQSKEEAPEAAGLLE